MTNHEQIKDLIQRKDALKKFLDIEKTAAWIAEEEKKTEAPDFWNDPKEAQKVVKGIILIVAVLFDVIMQMRRKGAKKKATSSVSSEKGGAQS